MANVSVVMCCYNAEQYIQETIESVLGQTYTDFEFIIWNDGSTDTTETIIKSYHDSRIKYFYHENTGVGIARFLAGNMAGGQYIAIIDSDDICLPDRIEKESSFLDTHQDYVLVSSQMIYISQNGEQLGRSFSVLSDYVIRRKMADNSVISHSGCMYRKSIYDKVGGYSGIVLGEDHVLFSKMMKYGKVCILPYPLVKYRIRDLSLMHVVQGNAYMPILNAFRRKMINDEVIFDEDVTAYNHLYLLSRKSTVGFRKSSDVNRHVSLEERFMGLLKPLLGEVLANRTIVSLKNFFFVVYYALRGK
jgi:glycosyltransferase involved in cell wall biosynthesis